MAHDNRPRNHWIEKDWTQLLRLQIAKGQHRHVGDLCIELGITGANAQYWSQKHAEFAELLWAEPCGTYARLTANARGGLFVKGRAVPSRRSILNAQQAQ